MTNTNTEETAGVAYAAMWHKDKTKAVHITYVTERGIDADDLADFWGCEVDEAHTCDISEMKEHNVKFGSDAQPIHFRFPLGVGECAIWKDGEDIALNIKYSRESRPHDSKLAALLSCELSEYRVCDHICMGIFGVTFDSDQNPIFVD